MCLYFILLPTLSHLTQCSTWQVFHITRLLFNLISLRLQSLGDLLPVYLQLVSGQGFTLSSSPVCAFVCWLLQPMKVLLNAAQFSFLRDMRTTNANLSRWKRNSFSFPYLFSTVFYCSHYQPYTNVKFTTCLSIFSKKSYVKIFPSCPGMYVVKDRWQPQHWFPPIYCWYPQTGTWNKDWMVVRF